LKRSLGGEGSVLRKNTHLTAKAVEKGETGRKKRIGIDGGGV